MSTKASDDDEADTTADTGRGGTITADPELVAMPRIDKLLRGLNAEQRARVMVWLQSRHSGFVNPLGARHPEAKE